MTEEGKRKSERKRKTKYFMGKPPISFLSKIHWNSFRIFIMKMASVFITLSGLYGGGKQIKMINAWPF